MIIHVKFRISTFIIFFFLSHSSEKCCAPNLRSAPTLRRMAQEKKNNEGRDSKFYMYYHVIPLSHFRKKIPPHPQRYHEGEGGGVVFVVCSQSIVLRTAVL